MLQKDQPSQGTGPDGVSGRAPAGVFSDIFYLSLSLSVLPTRFKRTTTVPVPKNTKATDMKDYRPIALTSMKCSNH